MTQETENIKIYMKPQSGVTKEKLVPFEDTLYKVPGIYGGIHLYDGETSQAIPAGATYTKLTGFDGDNISSHTSPDYANSKIVLAIPGVYQVSGASSFSCGTNNVIFYGSAFLGDAEQDSVHFVRKIATAGDVGATSITGTIEVGINGADLDFRIRHDNVGSVDITIVYMNFNVHYLGR